MQEIWSTVLTSFAGPTTSAASDGGPAGNSRLAGAPHRAGQFVDRDRRAAGHQVGQHLGEMLDALVEFEVERAVDVVGGQLRTRRRCPRGTA